jgi:hypothetical protein
MSSLNVRKVLSVTVAVAAMFCLAAPMRLAAANPDAGANITFTASGTFAASPVSGADGLLLSGLPFTISVVGNSSMVPIQHGKNWAIFKPLQMNGTIYSALEPGQPLTISSTTAAVEQAFAATKDIFQAGFPIPAGTFPNVPALTVRAFITLPPGTLATALLRPFASVALDPTNATITYASTTASTVLAVQSGTLVATKPAGGTTKAAASAPFPFVLLAGAQAVKPRGLPTICL